MMKWNAALALMVALQSARRGSRGGMGPGLVVGNRGERTKGTTLLSADARRSVAVAMMNLCGDQEMPDRLRMEALAENMARALRTVRSEPARVVMEVLDLLEEILRCEEIGRLDVGAIVESIAEVLRLEGASPDDVEPLIDEILMLASELLIQRGDFADQLVADVAV